MSISLESKTAAMLFVSKDTPQNGWGTPPKATYEHRLNTRRDNGKLVHGEALEATLTLTAGEYTAEAVATSGRGGRFTLTIAPRR